jgi:putative membrane protein
MPSLALEITVRYLHFVSVFLLAASLWAQVLSLRPVLTRGEIARLQRIDLLYAAGAILVLATGLLQWLAVGKPADFYTRNPVFHAKLTLFLVIGLASAYPSVFFARQRKGPTEESVPVPAAVVWSVRAEVGLLAVLPLLANLMARGIGYAASP